MPSGRRGATLGVVTKLRLALFDLDRTLLDGDSDLEWSEILGAAGAIEAVFALIAIREQFLPPNLNYQEADPAWELAIVANESRKANVRRVMSNSFGFGGTNASIILQAA